MVPPPPPPPPKPAGEHKSSFSFGSSKPTQSSGPSQELTHHMSDVNRRVRMVEESLANLRKKVELENENSLSDKRATRADIQAIYEELNETKKVARTVQDTITKMIREVQTLAKKEDVQVLQKYVDIWKPIQFVTQQEVTSIVQAELARMQKNSQQFSQSRPQQSFTQIEDDPTETIIEKEVDEQPQTTQTPAQPTLTQKSHTPTDEQKRRIAQFIEAHEDIKDMILHNVDEFIEHVKVDDMLQTLFKGVDIHAFSQKLQQAYDVKPKHTSKAASRNDEIFGHHSSTKLDDMLKK